MICESPRRLSLEVNLGLETHEYDCAIWHVKKCAAVDRFKKYRVVRIEKRVRGE
jgi:hypothetical protein